MTIPPHDKLPVMDYTIYGRQCGHYAESEGFLVVGHDRYSYAALSAMGRDLDGPGWGRRYDPKKVRVDWVVFVEECGCTSEQHKKHIGDSLYCTEFSSHEYDGLPPCGDEYSWVSVNVKPDAPGAVPVLVYYW